MEFLIHSISLLYIYIILNSHCLLFESPRKNHLQIFHKDFFIASSDLLEVSFK